MGTPEGVAYAMDIPGDGHSETGRVRESANAHIEALA